MALTLNTNSYVTLDGADAYLETRIDSANWFDATDEIKEQALVTATTMVDNRAWIGYAVSSSQALAWPRKNASYYSTRMGQTITVATNVVPDEVKIAVYEQALHLTNNEDLLTGQTTNYESISIGSISISDSNGDVTRVSKTPSEVTRPIRDLVKRGGMGGMGSSWWRSN
jgi:hypothetical protein